MKETTIKIIPSRIELAAWAVKASEVLNERARNPQDLNDALLAVYLENTVKEISGQILLATLMPWTPTQKP